MNAARHRWVFPDPIRLDPVFAAAAREQGLGRFAAAVAARRGIATPAELAAFLGSGPDAGPGAGAASRTASGLHDPWLLPDAAALVERISAARKRGERVMVFGDFDADGLTGLAQLVYTLERLGLVVLPYVPSRLDEGHGLSLAAVEAAAAAGAALIVTVDTGSTSIAEIAAAGARGIDVIVTDHHHLPAELPAAVAVVNPHRADSRYPERELSGSGVAFTVSRLLLGSLASAEDEALQLADLAVIGTVADVVPLLGENRVIARLGLALLQTAPRPGIAALLARGGGGRGAARGIDAETISYVLAPRLNAASRVGEAMDAARLLLARTPEEAAELAAALEAANATRRDLMKVAIAQARAALGLGGPDTDSGDVAGALDASPEIIAAGGPEAAASLVIGPWSVGIVGLVAGRLADETGRPAIIGTRVGDTIRCSCRGDGRMNLATALDACGDLFIRHGGHAAAAGFELPAASWEAFTGRFLALAASWAPEDPRPPLNVDLALPADLVDYGLYRDLQRLQPCGAGNPEPLVAVLGLTVARVRAANGGHSQLVLRRGLDVIDGIAFGRADLAADLVEGDCVDVVARLASRVFGGAETLQLEVRDVAPSGTHPRAAAVLGHLAERRAAATEPLRLEQAVHGGPA